VRIISDKKKLEDILSFLKPKRNDSQNNLTPEEKLTHRIQEGIFKVFSESLMEYGVEKAKEYYPIWQEEVDKWKNKLKDLFKKK